MAQTIAELCIERWALSALKPHPRNPRTHAEPGTKQWAVLEASLQRDYFDPLVVNRRNAMLVSGHFRLKVLAHLGYLEADVSVVDYDEPTHLARLIAANELLGKWEADLLDALAKDIDAAGIDARLAGWDEKQMALHLEGPTVTDDTDNAVTLVSKADELQREWQVQLGDLYQIGPHRLLCGDCTSEANWQMLLGDSLADMVWTDPPYNIDYDAIQRRRIELQTARKPGGTFIAPEKILNDHLSEGAYAALLSACFAVAFEFTKPGGALYVAHADSFGLLTRQMIAQSGWYLAQCLVWVKNSFTLGRQDYQWQHEPVLYGWKPGAAHYWQGGFNQASVIDDEEKHLSKLGKEELIAIIQRLRNARDTSIIREPRNTGNILHPTVKPLPLVARHIWNSSHKDETVLELFGGSGTTLLAAHQTGRRAVATELDPKFCAVILQRLKDAGLSVEKTADKSAFTDVAA